MDLSEFFVPEGELHPDWFPMVEAEDLLKQQLDDARGDARITGLASTESRERAIAAYVYWKAYKHIYRRKANDPNQWAADGQGSQQTSNRQVSRWKEMADEKEDEFMRYVDEGQSGDDVPGVVSVPTPSGYV